MLCRRGLLLLLLLCANLVFTTTIGTDTLHALPYHLVWHGGPPARAAPDDGFRGPRRAAPDDGFRGPRRAAPDDF